MVRAKMTVVAHTTHNYPGTSVALQCEYDQNCPEDLKFCKATPSGKCELYIDNPAALAQFKLGQTFYLTFCTPEEQNAIDQKI